MPATLSISDLRKALGPVFSKVVQAHRPVMIERRRESGLLLGADDVLALLRDREFHPEVFHEKGAVSVWLPELELYGRGGSFAEARNDLVEEVRDYVREYLEESELYLRAPNRAHHFPYVIKAWLSDTAGELAEVLFAEPQAAKP